MTEEKLQEYKVYKKDYDTAHEVIPDTVNDDDLVKLNIFYFYL